MGTDIIGPINPPSSRGHIFILAATDYFSKWAEAIPLRDVKAHTVEDFFRTHIIYRYGVPAKISSDNGTPFRNRVLDKFFAKYNIKQQYSTPYNATPNGLAEAFKATPLCKLLKKVKARSLSARAFFLWKQIPVGCDGWLGHAN